MLQWLQLTIDKIQSCKKIDDLKVIMIDIQEKLEYDFIIYNIQFSSSFKETFFISIGTFPNEWIKHYISKNYASIDPIVKHCISSNTPISWHQFYKDENYKIYNLFKEVSDYELLGGASIGYRVNSGEVGIFSISKKEPLTEKSKLYCNTILYMTSLQPYIHDSLKRVSNNYNSSDSSPLTKRELECLTWTAEGKTSGEIASILHISESTVIFHIKNIINKLEVSNRTQAISKAILTGLISTNSDVKKITYLPL